MYNSRHWDLNGTVVQVASRIYAQDLLNVAYILIKLLVFGYGH